MKHLFTRAPAVFAGAAALLAGGLMAAPASAQGEAESMMVLGGYTNYTVSFTKFPNGDGDPAASAPGIQEQDGDISIYNNTEIFFNGSGETDGGLQVSARVELEGHSENDQIDEHFITVSGGFGSLEIGANDGADERTAKGIFYNGSAVDYYYWNTITVPNSGYYGPGTYSDGMGVTYTTPSLGGASFAIGYKPSREDGESRGERQFGDENVITFGAKYEGDMDGISFAGSFGYGTYDIPAVTATAPTLIDQVETEFSTDDDGVNTYTLGDTVRVISDKGVTGVAETTVSKWGAGVNLGFGDTTLYARYDDQESEPDGGNSTDTKAVSVAVSHVIGPVKLGLGWRQGTITKTANGRTALTGDDNEFADVSGDASDVEQENEDTMLIGSVDYSLGSGVTLSGYVAWGETEQTGAVHDTDNEHTTGVGNDEGASQEAMDMRKGKTGATKDAENTESGTAIGIALNLAF